jgi:xanthine/uracil permease
MMFQITELGGKVIFGTVIIVVGMFLARILANLVGSSTGEASYAQTVVKYAIIALFTAIGLTFMGLADQIVMLAFGLILGSAAVATAIAFGLGGRDYAARLLEEWHESNTPPAIRRAPPPRLKKAPQPEDDNQPPLV